MISSPDQLTSIRSEWTSVASCWKLLDVECSNVVSSDLNRALFPGRFRARAIPWAMLNFEASLA